MNTPKDRPDDPGLSDPPGPQCPPGSASPAPKAGGCLRWFIYTVVGFALFVIVLTGGLYYVVMHTSLPLKLVASLIQKSDPTSNLKIQGVTGSISTGCGIKSIRWGSGGPDANEIADIRIMYSGPGDILRNKLIFRDVNVGKAHFDVGNWRSSATSSTSSGASSNTAPQRAASNPSTAPIELFQIDRMNIKDVAITNRSTSFSLSIPSIEWTGLKVAKGVVDLGRLKVVSDRLDLATKDGRTVEVDGEEVAFQKVIEGIIKPAMHPSIRKPVSFAADLNMGIAWESSTFRLLAFDEKLDIFSSQGALVYIRARELDLTEYFNATLPQSITLDVVNISSQGSAMPTERVSGSFRLGVSVFDIKPQEFAPRAEAVTTEVIKASCRTSRVTYNYELIMGKNPMQTRQRLLAQPPMSAQNIIGSVFFGMAYSDLSDAQRKEADGMLSDFLFEPDTSSTVSLQR